MARRSPKPRSTVAAGADARGSAAHRNGRLANDLAASHKAVLDSALDPIITIDDRGTIRSASRSVDRVFGYTARELVGRNIRVLMPEPYRSGHDAQLERVRRTGVGRVMDRPREFEGLRKNGTRVPIEVSISRVGASASTPTRFVGIVRDISARKRLEEELAVHRTELERLVRDRTRELERSHEQLRVADRLAAIGTLAAGLGHDMNNVLFPIRCRLDAMAASTLPAALREQLLAIRRSIEYLQQLSEGLNLLARDPAEGASGAASTAVPQWWAHVGVLLRRAVPRFGRFEASLEKDLPPVAIAPHRLTQAALNLVVNAGEAIKPGGLVRLWASTHPDPRYVRIGVTDDGCGMAANVKRHALEPFFTTKKRGLGTGLGLPLVRSVVHDAGGYLSIDSTPNAGTTVTLTFPAARTEPAAPASRGAACISVAEARTASFLSAMVRALGFEPSVCDAGSFCRSRLWVTEPGAAALRAARRYLADDPTRRVVVLGKADRAWSRLGAVRVRDPESFERVRDGLAQAAVSLHREDGR